MTKHASDNECGHCQYVGRQYSIVDSEDKACELRIARGVGRYKHKDYHAFQVCPQCSRINIK